MNVDTDNNTLATLSASPVLSFSNVLKMIPSDSPAFTMATEFRAVMKKKATERRRFVAMAARAEKTQDFMVDKKREKWDSERLPTRWGG